mmetsp:Transcript_50795/g.119052  ORF Transcript_50795/g.119052 Transcript_50795/m.119052 type:complete len:293 (+) Transcript_50795:140-1018(+)
MISASSPGRVSTSIRMPHSGRLSVRNRLPSGTVMNFCCCVRTRAGLCRVVNSGSSSFFFSSLSISILSTVSPSLGVVDSSTVSMGTLPVRASFSRSFSFSRALALAVVLRTAVATFSAFFSSASLVSGGYANKDGLVCEVRVNAGISRFLFSPMMHVGWKLSEMKCINGYQYQYWVNTAIPTTPDIRGCPELERSPMVTLRPPASMMPEAMMAPNLAMTSSCLSEMTLVNISRTLFTLGSRGSVDCTSTMARAMSAPWRTKSTGSEAMGSRSSRASLSPVPAQEMPTARVAP